MAATIQHSRPFGTVAWRPAVASLSILLTLMLVGVLSVIRLSPPAVAPATAPATMFSAARAMVHLREIAQRPHPTGSLENAGVRAYLVDQLAALGVQPEVQRATSVNHQPGVTTAAVVHNIVARIPGTVSSGALLLVAHYDTVPTSPGASDDGAGVVTILETVRALLAGPALQNDVIVPRWATPERAWPNATGPLQ